MRQFKVGIGLLAGAALSIACAKTEKPEPTATQTQPANTSAAAATATAAPKVPEIQLPTPPASLGKPKIPANNPLTSAKVLLGNKLFFDKRLSVDGTRACYSCHLNEDGTGGHDPIAIGAKESRQIRSAERFAPKNVVGCIHDVISVVVADRWRHGRNRCGKNRGGRQRRNGRQLDEGRS